MSTLRAACVLATSLALVAGAARDAQACAAAVPEGEAVRIVDEEALIAFDSERGVEHFVRRAHFAATSPDFGFLVPTPSVPELGEIDDAIFDTLARRLTPPVIVEHQGVSFEFGSLFDFLMRAKSAASSNDEVRVLAVKRVAGLDATVLEASDPAALVTWLGAHGYARGPALEAWLAPYVAKGWKISAFKIATDGKRGGAARFELATKALRMSFATKSPFYPYREPEDQRETLPASHTLAAETGKRSLRVYFVGRARVLGTIGAEGRWPAHAVLAEPVAPPWIESLRLPDYPTHDRWLTVFEDDSSPRPGTDEVFFTVSQDATPISLTPDKVVRPRVVTFPVELGVGVAGLAGVIAWRRRRARRT